MPETPQDIHFIPEPLSVSLKTSTGYPLRDVEAMKDASVRRRISVALVLGIVIFFAGSLYFDSWKETDIAEKWWASTGPFVGYILRFVLEGPGTGGSQVSDDA